MPLIRDIFWTHRRRYGARRISMELASRGEPCGVARVAKLLETQGLKAIQPKSFRPRTTNSRHRLGYNSNLLREREAPQQINEVWVGDITYIPLHGVRFGYMSLLMDLYSRRVVGWEYQDSMTDALVLSSLKKAIRERQPATGLIHHSDRGGQYASGSYRDVLRRASRINASKHERSRQLLRQCLHGIVLRHAEDRAGIDRVRRQRGSGPRAVDLSALLQPGPPSFIARLPHPSRVRNPNDRADLRTCTVRAT